MNKVLAYPCRKIPRKIMPAHVISLQVWNELQALFALQQQFVVNIISFCQRTVYKEWFHTQSSNLKMSAHSEQLMSWTYTLHKDLRAHQNTKYNFKTKYPLAKRFELTKKLLPPIFPNIFQRSL